MTAVSIDSAEETMHRTRSLSWNAVCASLLVALALLAVQPSVSVAADEPEKPLKVTGDLGFVSTDGNSDVQTLTGNDKVEYKTGQWLFTQDGSAVWGTDHGAENAGRYLLGLRGDYTLTERVGLYGLGTWRRNTFAGIARQFNEGVGVAYHALIPRPQQLDLEVGTGLSQRRTTLGEDEDFSTGRLAALYRYYFKEKAYVEAGGEYLANFKDSDDYEWNTKTSIVAPLGGFLALKVGYNYQYRNAPPDGFRKWDSTFATGIQMTY
jgi:putative salt-induced outer membrane protein